MSDMIEKRTPEQIGAEIREIISIGRDVKLRLAVEIGRRLWEVKRELKHGEWLPWLQRETKLSERSAQNYMKIFTEYGNRPMPKEWENLNISQAMWLISVPDDEKEEVVKGINASELSVRDLKKEIKKRNGESNGRKRTQTIQNNVDLKQCPHCGGDGELMVKGTEAENGNVVGYILVKCSICGATGASFYYNGSDPKEWDHTIAESVGGRKAITAWNLRWPR